jgi:hypothetical protein
MQILVYKLAIGLVCAALCVLFVRSSRIMALTDRHFYGLMLLLWGVTRVGLYCAGFIVLRMAVTSDIIAAYYPEAIHALKGEVIYRDFISTYAPAFPYLTALILKVWNSPKAIILATTLIDAASFSIWLQIARTTWVGSTSRTLAIFYVFSSFAILNVAIAGQNQTWAALILGAAVLLCKRGRPILSGMVAGLPVLLVKFLPLIFLPLFIRRGSNPVRVASAALALPVTFLFGMWVQGIDIFQPIRFQAHLITPGNLPYLLTFWKLPDGFSAASQVLLPGGLAVLSVYLVSRTVRVQGDQIIFGMAVLTLVCALLSRKFYTNYLMMVFAPMCAIAAVGSSPVSAAVRFGVFNLVISLEPSLWFRLLNGEDSHLRLWQIVSTLQQDHELWKLWTFLPLEAALLGFYAYYLLKAWRLLTQSLQR